MPDHFPTSKRKADHIRINLQEDVQSSITTGLENYHFIHEALPEINLRDVDLSQVLFGKRLAKPILISSMTGGTEEAYRINCNLAQAAEDFNLAMGVGSQRAALEKPESEVTFQVRKIAPHALLFANLGAVQLNYGVTITDCQRAVDMIEADALILHLNALQEALQPEGNTNFRGLLARIEQVCRSISVPVIIKEVGWGISGATARRLIEVGVKVIDVAGAGGTSWSQVEKFRAEGDEAAEIAAAFRGWGIPTAESIQLVKASVPDALIFASGGLRDGLDIAKCIGLGAYLGGIARPFLQAASISGEQVNRLVERISREMEICLFSLGKQNLTELRGSARLVCEPDTGRMKP